MWFYWHFHGKICWNLGSIESHSLGMVLAWGWRPSQGPGSWWVSSTWKPFLWKIQEDKLTIEIVQKTNEKHVEDLESSTSHQERHDLGDF